MTVKYPGELVYTLSVGGGKASGTHRGGNPAGGGPNPVVDQWKLTHAAGGVALSYDLSFVEHRRGKDVYRTTYKVTAGGGTTARTFETEYDGKRAVVVEDQYGSVVIQAPTQDPKQ